MPDSKALADALSQRILSAVDVQLQDLQPDPAFLSGLANTSAQLGQLQALLQPLPNDPAIQPILTAAAADLAKITSGKAPRATLAQILASLTLMDQTSGPIIDQWIAGGKAPSATKDAISVLLKTLIQSVRQLLAQRPDVTAILDDLTAIKNLRGGPADAVAYHDFQVLQMAFEDVWLHAFDSNLQNAAEDLYTLLETDKVLNFDPNPTPNLSDVTQLQELIAGLQYQNPDPIPQEVWQAFGTLAMNAWSRLSAEQQFAVQECAKTVNSPLSFLTPMHPAIGPVPPSPGQQAQATGEAILKAAAATPQSPKGRLEDLITKIQTALAEPYHFDVFAPDSYNYGLMLTYRQRWEPGPYQAGDLKATIPLAPGETRKFTKKLTIKTARAVKEIEKSMSSRSNQSSETSRAEFEIMQRATSATNFKMTTNGSFNIGIGSIGATSEFGANQEQQSAVTKKGLHEATMKAAEEYRLERSLEVDTSTSTEQEEATSGEISNPNNEITVTYLFYELQRRYAISEFLYRARPVILVAQDVPAPNEIDEAWLLKYQWIIARVVLDDSLLPALTYLNSGFAGDELGVEVKRTHWEAQKHYADAMETKVQDQLSMRDSLRESLVATTLSKDSLPSMPGALKFFTFGVDPSEAASDLLEAKRKAIQTRLGYSEAALSDAQDKLKQAASSLESATKEYSEALQNQFNRRVAIDQLRIHVKQNILFYMQAIWDQEPPDQRFFRLYKKPVICAEVGTTCMSQVTGVVNPAISQMANLSNFVSNLASEFRGATSTAANPGPLGHQFEITRLCTPTATVGGPQHTLVQVADLDNPLGYKGNYIIFPLIHSCHLTDYMLSSFIDDYLGLIDPDGSDTFVAEDFDARWTAADGNADAQAALRTELLQYLTVARRAKDEIIVPTGQLFIEALPGSHPLLEDFKLLHRAEDVLKVKAEVRHAELENLRLAARLAAGEHADPDIEKQILVTGNAALVVDGSG